MGHGTTQHENLHGYKMEGQSGRVSGVKRCCESTDLRADAVGMEGLSPHCRLVGERAERCGARVEEPDPPRRPALLVDGKANLVYSGLCAV